MVNALLYESCSPHSTYFRIEAAPFIVKIFELPPPPFSPTSLNIKNLVLFQLTSTTNILL